MSSPKYKVAIIEDDFSIVQMYQLKFQTEGFDVQTAGDGETGLELIESYKPNIVLLDLMMPNMNGLDMLSKLRSSAEGSKMKVIVLTNMGDTETATRVFKMSANDYIVKAELTPKQVVERVQKLLAA